MDRGSCAPRVRRGQVDRTVWSSTVEAFGRAVCVMLEFLRFCCVTHANVLSFFFFGRTLDAKACRFEHWMKRRVKVVEKAAHTLHQAIALWLFATLRVYMATVAPVGESRRLSLNRGPSLSA